MKFGRKIILSLLCVAGFFSAASADEASSALKRIAAATKNSFGLVRCKIADELGTRYTVGTGISISPQIMMTYAVDTRVRTDKIESIEVIAPGVERQTFEAKLLGVDPASGLSFIQVAQGFPWKPIGFVKSSKIELGDMVLSAGLSIGDAELSQRVGCAYVSNLTRTPASIYTVSGGTLTGVGSVVFNAAGQAIGMVTSQPYVNCEVMISRKNMTMPIKNDEFTVAFLPVEEFVYILQQIPQDGKARRLPWIGVQRFAPVQKTLMEAKGLNTPAVMIDQIIPSSQAATLGLNNRDLIIAINGQPLEAFASPELVALNFTRCLMSKSVGDKVKFTVVQGSQKKDVELTLMAMPKMPSEADKLYIKKLGLLMREKVALDKQLDDNPAADTQGLLVLSVAPNTPADRAGLKAGDVVIGINNKDVPTANSGKEAIETAMSNRPPLDLLMIVQRGTERLRLTIETPDN